MLVFETILVLLFGATVLSALARRAGLPYPALLALGGAALIFVPGAPRLQLPPELILALFVAPVLLDSAYDVSLRDLRRNWLAVTSLALVAVVLTTLAVAVVARLLMPDMPLAAAVALGAVVAPPDAVAALTVLRQIEPPYRIRVVLEGEGLLNDAGALLIYKLAVGAVAAGSLAAGDILPSLAGLGLGSVAAGWLAAWPMGLLMRRFEDAATAVIMQFVATFALWLAAERLGLSSIIAIVVFALTLSQRKAFRLPARLRVPSFAIWEVVTTLLNVLAFTLIGLQLGPILTALGAEKAWQLLAGALAVLATVMVVRFAWALVHHGLARLRARYWATHHKPPDIRSSIAIGWSGMRGIVTLAAAMALPAHFPDRDFIQLAAFTVVLGTLVLQGLTMAPLFRILGFRRDDVVRREVQTAREAVLDAALRRIDGDRSPAAQRLSAEYGDALALVRAGKTPYAMRENLLRTDCIAAARAALDALHEQSAIGDEAYRMVEEELDWEELGATPAEGR